MTDIQLNVQPENTTDEQNSAIENLSTCTLLELFGDPNRTIVHDREISITRSRKRVHIKQLSMAECAEIDAKKYSAGRRGQAERDIAAEEVTTIAWLTHCCVVKNSGTLESPKWSPLWSVDEIKGRSPEFDGKGNIVQEHPGLLGNPNHAAQELINHLTFVCWEVNPSLNPIVQAQAWQALGTGSPTITTES